MSDEKNDYYQLWHTGTGEPIKDFPRLADALPYVVRQNEVDVAQMSLKHVTPNGKRMTVAEGPELWAWAQSERGAPPRHRLMIISEPVRGRDAESIAVDLLKRVFLQGRLQLISIEVLREVDDSGDHWDNAFTGTPEQSGELWMRAVERFRAENKAYAAAARLQPSWEQLMRDIAAEAAAAGPEAVAELRQLREHFTREAQELAWNIKADAEAQARGAVAPQTEVSGFETQHSEDIDTDGRRRELLALIAVADAAIRREWGPSVVGGDRPDLEDFLRRAHDLLGRPGDYLTAWEREWQSGTGRIRELWPDLPERIARRREEIRLK